MKNSILKIAAIVNIIGYLLVPKKVYATDICQAAGSNFSALCKLKIENNAGGITGAIIQVILIFGIIVALFYLIFGGIKWMTSGGDRAKIAAARSQIIAALIGLVIAFAAFAIVNFVLYFFTGQDVTKFAIPRLID